MAASTEVELKRLVEKFIRVVSNDADNGWEDSGDELEKAQFSQFMGEYSSSFEEQMRLKLCVEKSVEEADLFEAVFDDIIALCGDNTASSSCITKDMFREYFLTKKINLFQSVNRTVSTSHSNDNDSYEDDDFEQNNENEDDYEDDFETEAVVRELKHALEEQDPNNAVLEMSAEQIVRHLFDLIDSSFGDGNGVLSKREVVRAFSKSEQIRSLFIKWLKTSGKSGSEKPELASMVSLFHNIDLNDDGEVSFDEFSQFLSKHGHECCDGQFIAGSQATQHNNSSSHEISQKKVSVNNNSTMQNTSSVDIEKNKISPHPLPTSQSLSIPTHQPMSSNISSNNAASSSILLPPPLLSASVDESLLSSRQTRQQLTSSSYPTTRISDDIMLKKYIANLALTDMLEGVNLPPPVPESRQELHSDSHDVAFSIEDFKSTFGFKPRKSTKELMSGFESIYKDILIGMVEDTKRATCDSMEESLLREAITESMSDCFNDPSIIKLLRQATELRLQKKSK